ncbi:MAG: hypothetical protein VX877_08610, partial [Planctomycetota bacterium]|nr:hypothetical protein [Planctomycetota bacterium]
FNAFSLEDLGDCLVNSHGSGLPVCGRTRVVWRKPICFVLVICVSAGILAATGRDLNAAAVLATGWTDFDFLTERGYNVTSPWPRDHLWRPGA